MKKIYMPMMLLVLLAAGSTVKAQMDSTKWKKNVVKINLSSLLFKNISLQYERVLGRKTSVALGVGIMPKSGLPFANSLQDQFGDNSDAANAIDQTKLSNISITPEFRWYLGRKPAPAGFYLAPFVRYNHMNFDQMYNFTASDGAHTANIKGTFNSYGVGLLLGSQWNLGKSMTLDWWIMGPAVGAVNGDLTGTDPRGINSAQDRADVKNDIETADIPGWTLTSTVTSNRIDVNAKGTYYGLRAFGICLGYKF